MLHYPDWDVPFEIHTDASSKAVAAILCQRIEENERVLMYASKTLSPAEQSYHIYEKRSFSSSVGGGGIQKIHKEQENSGEERLCSTSMAALEK